MLYGLYSRFLIAGCLELECYRTGHLIIGEYITECYTTGCYITELCMLGYYITRFCISGVYYLTGDCITDIVPHVT